MVIGTTFGAVSAQRGAPLVPAPMPPVLRDYRPVTAERLKNPEDDNWLMIRRTYDGWGFSPLDADHAGERRAPAVPPGCSRPPKPAGIRRRRSSTAA